MTTNTQLTILSNKQDAMNSPTIFAIHSCSSFLQNGKFKNQLVLLKYLYPFFTGFTVSLSKRTNLLVSILRVPIFSLNKDCDHSYSSSGISPCLNPLLHEVNKEYILASWGCSHATWLAWFVSMMIGSAVFNQSTISLIILSLPRFNKSKIMSGSSIYRLFQQ